MDKLLAELPVSHRHSATAPASLRPALLCSMRGWIRIGSRLVNVVERWSLDFDDRPGSNEEAAELWMDSIGG